MNAVAIVAVARDLNLTAAFAYIVQDLNDRVKTIFACVEAFCQRYGQDSPKARQARAILAFTHGFHTWHTTAPRFVGRSNAKVHLKTT